MRKIFLISLLFLSSCAYFSHGEPITVTTSNGKPAYCVLKNDQGNWHGYSGKPIEIKPSSADLLVNCAMNGLKASKTVKADAKKTYPDFIMLTLKAGKRKTGSKQADAGSADAPEDNDENSAGDTLNNDNSQYDQEARPLNVLPDAPEDPEDKVVIIRHN